MIIRKIYKALKKAGCNIGSHESDLYVIKDNVSENIVNQYDYKCNVTTFINGGKTWYEIPFAYEPFWNKKLLK